MGTWHFIIFLDNTTIIKNITSGRLYMLWLLKLKIRGCQQLSIYVFLIIAILLFLGIMRIIKNIFKIEYEEGLYKQVNNIHKWGEILLVILSLLVLYFISFVSTHQLEPHYFIVSLILINSFRAFMEWKFKKFSKKYIISILSSSFLFIIFIVFELFFT